MRGQAGKPPEGKVAAGTPSLAPRPSVPVPSSAIPQVNLDALSYVKRSETLRARSGPLPSPDDLKRYREVDPEIVTLLLGTFDSQVVHRLELEKQQQRDLRRQQDQDYVLSLVGQAGGLVVALSGFVAATWMVLADHPVAGVLLGVAELAALVGVFVLGRQFAEVAPESAEADKAEPDAGGGPRTGAAAVVDKVRQQLGQGRVPR